MSRLNGHGRSYEISPMCITPDKDKGVGAIRKCHLYDGNKAVEKIVSWDEKGRTYTIDLIEGTLPMDSVKVTLTAVPVGTKQTKLVADMDLVAKFGLLGWVMERVAIKPQLGGAIGDLFAGLEEFGKTGVDIQEGFKGKTPALVK